MRIILAVQKGEVVSDRMTIIPVKVLWCHIIVLNIHSPTEDNIDDVKDSFYEELERVFVKFSKYHTTFC
jgi:hypothetical protein